MKPFYPPVFRAIFFIFQKKERRRIKAGKNENIISAENFMYITGFLLYNV